MKSETRWFFTEVRFLQTYSPLRWSQRPGLFQPFRSLKRSPKPSELLFSINRDTKSPQDHHTIGVSCLDYNWVGNKKERRRQAIQAQELKWTQMSLSLDTIWLEWTLDLHYRKLVKERGWQTVELNVISRRTYRKNVGLPTNIADGDFWTNLEK
jgi:hypothetical protein